MYQVKGSLHPARDCLPKRTGLRARRRSLTFLVCVCSMLEILLTRLRKIDFIEFQVLKNMRGKYRQRSERLNGYSVDPDPVDLKESIQTPRQSTRRREWRVLGLCRKPREVDTISQSVSPVVMATLKFMSMI